MPSREYLNISGMSCVNCARGVENILSKAGARDVSVDFSSSSASFEIPENLSIEKLKLAVSQAGYKIIESQSDSHLDAHQHSALSLENKFFISLAFSLPLFMHMFVDWHVLHNPWVQLTLSTPVLILGLIHFGSSALTSLKAGAANMDVLIVIGVVAAYIYSLIGLLSNLGPNYLFFETSTTITTIVLFGNLLEHWAVKKTTTSIKELSALKVAKAKRVIPGSNNQALEEIDCSHIAVDDLLLINSGDQVPTDGIVISGSGEVDESILTGESLPVQKSQAAELIGSTILVRGNIYMQAKATGDKTVLAQLIRLVRDANLNKPKIQKIGDKVSEIFIPAVLSFAILTFLVSLYFAVPVGTALLRAIAVLVVACPCAIGLATPSAVMVGIGKAARKGVLLRGGQTLEILANVKQVVFDKTGTLTTGEFNVTDIKTIDISESQAKSIILGLERYSSHPIAKSITRQWSDITAHNFSNVTEDSGLGISGTDLHGENFSLVPARNSENKNFLSFDVVLKKGTQSIAAFKLGDALKPEAQATIQQLQELNINSALLSGDREEKCRAVAETLGMQTYYSQQTPADKLKILAKLDSEMACAYVGDGINDAPALSQARIGISLSNASQIAMQSSQVVLLNGKLNLLVDALKISKLTLSTIKQNLFWAFFYNVLMIPLAAFGYLSPTIAALSMAFSDVVIVGNSLRLIFRK